MIDRSVQSVFDGAPLRGWQQAGWMSVESAVGDFASAIFLGVDSSMENVADASISVPGEQDYYRFTLTVAAMVAVTTGGDPDGDGDILLYIYDDTGRRIDCDDDGGSGRYSQVTRLFDAATYYIVVCAKGDTVIDRYSLTVDVTEFIPEPPAVISVKASDTAPTNRSVTVTATFNAFSAVRQYRINDGDWLDYSGGVVVAGNCTVSFRGIDLDGNVSEVVSYAVNNIDDVPPEVLSVTADVTTPTNKPVTLTATFSDDAVVMQYCTSRSDTVTLVPGDNGFLHVVHEYTYEWSDYADGVEIAQNSMVYFRCLDAAGNASEIESYLVGNIDTKTPVLISVTADITEPTNGDVTITVAYDDACQIRYSFAEETWTDIETRCIPMFSVPGGDLPTVINLGGTLIRTDSWQGSITVSANTTVYFQAVDEAGNVSEVTVFEVTNIDRTPPEKPVASADITAPTDRAVTVTAVFSDDSVVRQYSMDGATWLDYPAAVVMTANGVVYFRAFDAVGNVSEVTAYEVANIDRVAPDPPVAAADVTAPTNRNVTVTADFGDRAVVKQYRIGEDGDWLDYADGAVMTDNGVVYFRGIGADGSVSNFTAYIVDNIDRTPPEKPTAFHYSTSSPTKYNVTIKAIFSADSVRREYRINDGEWREYVDGAVMADNGVVYFRGIDEAGNASEVTEHEVTNIDRTPPSRPTVSADIIAPTNGEVTLTATCGDDAVMIQYSFDGSALWSSFGSWKTYTDGVVMSDNGTVYFRTVDAAGNVSSVLSCFVDNIDRTAPEKPTAFADVTTPTNGDVTVAATFSDDSVLRQYLIDDGDWRDYSDGVVVAGNCTVYFRGVDAAGNISEVTSCEVANIDKTAPGKPMASADVTTPTNRDVTVTATFDADSVVRQYSLDGVAWLDYTDGVVMSANGVVYFRAFDAAGNVSEVASYDVANIDRVAPAPPVAAADVTTPTNGSVTVTAEFGDKAVVKQYRIGEYGDWLDYVDGAVMTDNGTVYFRGISAEGNASNVTAFVVDNIDKIPPEQPVASADVTEITVGTVTVTATFSGDSPVKQYSLDGETWREYADGVAMAENGTVYFRAFDAVGNVSEVVGYEVSNIVAVTDSGTGDVNGDGRADIVMSLMDTTDPHCGASGAWLIQEGDELPVWGNLSQRHETWELFGTGKTALGKKTCDVYLRSESNIIGAWVTDDRGEVVGWHTVCQFDSDTQVLGLGDFNGDGQSDLLLRNVNGSVGCYLTDGNGWNYFQSIGREWSICAVGDFDGDGRDDVVLKHAAGFAGCWLTQSDCTMAWADLDTLPEGFEIVGAGDFNGDGTDDVLLKQGTYYGAWIVANGNASSWMGLGDLGDRDVEQIGDFDGDGIDDLRVRTAAGDLGAMFVRGEDDLVWHYYGPVGSEWSTRLASL